MVIDINFSVLLVSPKRFQELRNEFEKDKKEDTILDLLDHVVGWGSPKNQIWEKI